MRSNEQNEARSDKTLQRLIFYLRHFSANTVNEDHPFKTVIFSEGQKRKTQELTSFILSFQLPRYSCIDLTVSTSTATATLSPGGKLFAVKESKNGFDNCIVQLELARSQEKFRWTLRQYK